MLNCDFICILTDICKTPEDAIKLGKAGLILDFLLFPFEIPSNEIDTITTSFSRQN